ncbi:hypothetical protein F5882DRAFT_376833 [Hyaloscypha sp. PMI_1271]|nr:hypothetical protein F5882DRAFT_376833 [Hyaloscypha sp. PMI_1271]
MQQSRRCSTKLLASTAEPAVPAPTTAPHLDMASTNAQERLLDAPFEDFATSYNPHRICKPRIYAPEALLCKQSLYFAAMFEGPFKEGEEQSTTLEEIDGVVTPRSLQMLVQWVYVGRVVFGECAPDVSITTAIEFARLADMCRITGMEFVMAEHIRAIILANPAPLDPEWLGRAPDTNTYCLTSQHITSAVALPEGHPVRAILAAAAVEGCLRKYHYKFEREASRVPEFSVDLLKAVRAALESITIEFNATTFEDPISRLRFGLKRT